MAALLFAAGSLTQSDSRLASIQVKGIHRYAAEDVVRLSGLAIGKPATSDDLAAGANRLVKTGLFDMVKYTYTTGREMTVTFEIDEASWTIPVILDNFVWLTEDEVKKAVSTEVPTFDGTAPLNLGAAELIAQALQDVLKARGIPGRIEHMAQSDFLRGKAGPPRYMFTVKDPSPKLCGLHASGASAIPEKDLLAPLSSAVGGDYSRFFLDAASRGTLRDMYLRKGYWRIAFAPPVVSLEDCAGVTATLNVTEGMQYTWDRPSWSGNAAISSAELDEALGMKPGEVADSSKIDSGLRRLEDAYSKQGYVAEHASYDAAVEDASHKTAFRFTIEEGARYHMGTLEFPNLAENDANALKRKFKLKPGDVYDGMYVKKYLLDEVYPLQTKGGGHPNVDTNANPDTTTVTLRIVFK
jgi:outer membrane protein assembly factor BamA